MELRELNPSCQNFKCADVAQFYEPGIPPKGSAHSIANLQIAHMSSAAVRLCTIDERCPRINPRYLDLIKSEKKDKPPQRFDGLTDDQIRERLTQELLGRIDMWIHQMLRDNIGHTERSEAGNHKFKKLLWSARQDVIESLTIVQVVTAMEKVMKDFKKELIDKHII